MPTARGWLTAGTGIVLLLVGRAFGTNALEQLGVGLMGLVAVAAVLVRTRRHGLTVTRHIAPRRARAGQPVRVTLGLRNEGRTAIPLLLLDDRLPLDLAGRARFALGGVEAGGERSAAYEVRPPRRGRYDLGPLRISYVDPFGLAHGEATTSGTDDLLVHPRIERLVLPRDTGEQRSMAVSALRQLSGTRGEDFYTLREYATGDDLRKIHWPSTAKRAKTMIRQEETPWHTRATVLLDDRTAPDDPVGEPASFERCVEAAASLCDLYARSGYGFRLAAAHHAGMPSGRGSDHLVRCLDMLAMVQPQSAPGNGDPLLARLAELEAGRTAEGTLVLVTALPRPEVAIAAARCLRRFRQVLMLVFPTHRFAPLATRLRWSGEEQTRAVVTLLHRSGVPALVLGPGEPLATAWASLASGGKAGSVGGEQWDRKPAPA